MEMNQVALLTAFTAGVISFLSPCVLAVLPTCTAFLSSTGSTGSYHRVRQLWVNIGIFLSGFIVVFLVVGAGAAYLGQALHNYQHVISKIGAVFMTIMGLQLSGLISLSLTSRKFHLRFPTSAGPWNIFLLGVASTAAWAPCNGPLLAPVLVYASTSPSLLKGVALFFVYALGFCLPFALLAVTLERYLNRIRLFSCRMNMIQRIAGILLAISGVLIFFEVIG
ncbi:cytochrome c biogenesis CcdA family protein [Sporomusa sp.]|uniref:cytochrome c biogenesis CcdA family protein n=1 Tax=Sporomusa sp. TaxID=2078658 RepID=UPI002CC79605|nr:cytochrome c biogenesis CcdA family protein [Sporomusa sp.]HWR45445.1 cytochrome c biogenesis CcdA family protein [Sporomusa sp.]